MCVTLLCEPLAAVITAAPGNKGIMTFTCMHLNCAIVGPYDEKHGKTSAQLELVSLHDMDSEDL